jgi:hypothetical protein
LALLSGAEENPDRARQDGRRISREGGDAHPVYDEVGERDAVAVRGLADRGEDGVSVGVFLRPVAAADLARDDRAAKLLLGDRSAKPGCSGVSVTVRPATS